MPQQSNNNDDDDNYISNKISEHLITIMMKK